MFDSDRIASLCQLERYRMEGGSGGGGEMLPRDGGVHSRETSKLLSSGEQQVARTRSFRRVDPSSRYDSATELIYRSGMDVDNTRFSFFFLEKIVSPLGEKFSTKICHLSFRREGRYMMK